MKTIVGLIIFGVISVAVGLIGSLCLRLFGLKKPAGIFLIISILVPVLAFSVIWVRDTYSMYEFNKSKEWVHELCEKYGGDKIYKTVDNVEGIFQMKARPPYSEQELRDQYGMVDPYGAAQIDLLSNRSNFLIYSYVELDPIKGYLFVEKQPGYGLPDGPPYRRDYVRLTGLRFADVAPNYKQFYKDKPDLPDLKVVEAKVDKLLSRYGYLTEDISTKEMRDHWIAGGKITIINLQTKEVLAERVGYFRGEGGGQMPWAGNAANQNGRMCPHNSSLVDFLYKVLKPVINPTTEQIKAIAEQS